MFEIDNDMTIYITRGDVAFFSVTAEDNGERYKFQPGDVVRIKVTQKKNCENVAFQKDFPVLEETETVEILLTEEETKIGDVISKPVDYWYEVELNPYTNPQTIIGYDDDGPKIFKLFPEGRDLGTETEPEDVPVVDSELSLTSDRPVQNQAVTRAMNDLFGIVKKVSEDGSSAVAAMTKKVDDAVNKASKDTERLDTEMALERARINNLVANTGEQTEGNAELIDIRVGGNGITYETAGEAVRGQFSELKNELSRFLSSSGYHLSKSLCESLGITDANDLRESNVWFIDAGITEEDIKNLPCYGSYGLFFTLRHSETNPNGLTQFYVNKNEMCYRFEIGSGSNCTWYEWQFTRNNARTNFATGKSDNVLIDIDRTTSIFSIKGSGFIWGCSTFVETSSIEERSLQLTSTSAHTCLIYVRNNKLQQTNVKEYVAKTNDIILAEIFINADATINTVVWILGGENKNNHEYVANDMVCSIFEKVVCCGDSFTAGYISAGKGTTETNENFAWPAYMEKLTGSNYINCGRTGANVLTWQTTERGLPKAQSVGKAQAYIVGLGLNDQGASERSVPLGTAEDIGTDNQTYYGGLSKIVRELHAISPNAMIFLQTMPFSTTGYNTAIRDVAEAYSDTYNTHLLDLVNYKSYYQIPSVSGDNIGGHYTAIGYQQFAKILCKVMSDYINSHIADFQNVHLIEYE